MLELKSLTEEQDALKPFGQLDVLLLYAIVSSELERFLGDREIASKVWLKQRTLLNRGSQLPPLRVEEIAGKVTPDLLRARAKMGLAEARGTLNDVAEKIWRYFPPRKLCDYFYATSRVNIISWVWFVGVFGVVCLWVRIRLSSGFRGWRLRLCRPIVQVSGGSLSLLG